MIPRSAASFSATVWVWSIAPLVIGFLLIRLQLSPARVGLALFAVGLLGWLIAALVAVAAIIVTWLSGGGVPWLMFIAAGSFLALVLLFVLSIGAAGMKAPLIHDISTDTENPPRFEAAKRLRSPTDNSIDWAGEELATSQRLAYPGLGPVYIELPPAKVYVLVRQLANSRGWAITADDPERMRLEAVDRSPLWGFSDDVVIRVTATASGSRIDMRSASRVGRGDLGANARRIREFLAALRFELSKQV